MNIFSRLQSFQKQTLRNKYIIFHWTYNFLLLSISHQKSFNPKTKYKELISIWPIARKIT